MGHSYRQRLLGVAVMGALLSASACGSGLSGSSTCGDFMSADQAAQQKVIGELATKYNKPDYATPLGAPEVPYVCSQNPDLTLDEFFQRAG